MQLLYSGEFNIHLKYSSCTDWCAMFLVMSLWGSQKNHIEKPYYARSQFKTSVDCIFWLIRLCQLKWTQIWSAAGYFYHLYRQWFRSQLSYLYNMSMETKPRAKPLQGTCKQLVLRKAGQPAPNLTIILPPSPWALNSTGKKEQGCDNDLLPQPGAAMWSKQAK